MNKVIGITAIRIVSANNIPALFPPWLLRYPWLVTMEVELNGWRVALWGHGDLSHFVAGGDVVAGYSGLDLSALTIRPLQNRGLLLEARQDALRIYNDTLGAMQLFYAVVNGAPMASTCEEVLLAALGGATLDPAQIPAYFAYQCDAGTSTLWKEVKKLYANSTLIMRQDGTVTQTRQAPLRFTPPEGDAIEAMRRVTAETVARYTDNRGEVILPLSSGQDSRLLLCNMQAPERIHARSHPCSWPAENSWETRIAKRTAELCGVHDWAISDFGQDYSVWTEPSIAFYGTPISAVQTYIYGAAAAISGHAYHGLHIISGALGDVIAGIGVEHIKRNLERRLDKYGLYRMACYGHDKQWPDSRIDSVLSYNWRAEFESARAEGCDLWDTTEGDDIQKATMIRLRGHETQTVNYAWAALDLYGALVTPYCDRRYLATMLAMPYSVLYRRNGQQELFRRHYGHVWPHAGLDTKTMNCTNTMNLDTIRLGGARSIWPLELDGMLPNCGGLFKPAGVKSAIEQALSGDVATWFNLQQLQTIAWAEKRGYVRTH